MIYLLFIYWIMTIVIALMVGRQQKGKLSPMTHRFTVWVKPHFYSKWWETMDAVVIVVGLIVLITKVMSQ